MPGGPPNNRVSTQQFYEALLKQNDRMDEMERRILDEIKGVPNQVLTNKEEIDKLRKRSDIVDAIEGVLVLAASIFFGLRE